MKYRLIILAALVGLSVTPAFSAKKARRSDGMVGIRYLDSHFHLYDSLQKQIFNLAETAYDEYRSADQWMTFLTSQGFTVSGEWPAFPPPSWPLTGVVRRSSG